MAIQFDDADRQASWERLEKAIEALAEAMHKDVCPPASWWDEVRQRRGKPWKGSCGGFH